MRAIAFVGHPSAVPPGDPEVRWDLAWALFLPQSPGDLPNGDSRQCLPLANWFWDTMGRLGGRLRPDEDGTLWCVVPPLSEAAREFVIRLASFWADDVFWRHADDSSDDALENVWMPPLYDVNSNASSGILYKKFRESEADGEEARYAMPLLGLGRAFMRVEVIPPGKATARLHSHSAVDEYYLVLEGHGTLRMGGHAVAVHPHHLIGKPIGPDLTSHLVADRGETLVVLDMEIWPDTRLTAKDLVAYPDFNEILYRGPGWGAIAAEDLLMHPQDFRRHYEDGYKRRSDGTWESRAIPGTLPRQQ